MNFLSTNINSGTKVSFCLKIFNQKIFKLLLQSVVPFHKKIGINGINRNLEYMVR